MVMKCFADPGSECSCPMADRTGKTMREVSVLIPLGAVCLPAKKGKQKLSIYSSCAHHQTSSRQSTPAILRITESQFLRDKKILPMTSQSQSI